MIVRERAEIRRVAWREFELLIERSVLDGPAATLLGKTEGDLDHWLTFVGEPAVSPTNNAAENLYISTVLGNAIFNTTLNKANS